MRFGILGPVVVGGEGGVVQVRGLMPRTLLAALLVDANNVVSVPRLFGALWDDHPPDTARSSLQNHVTRLRAVLSANGGERIRTVAPGYLIQVAAGELDLAAFTGLHRRGLDAHRAGDWDGAACHLAGALRLWRGESMADVAAGTLRHIEARRLSELRLNALEVRIHADLQRGRDEEIIAELGALIAAYPMRERFHELLMLASYHVGRQAEALGAYQQARALLVSELGVEPGAGLRRLQERILAADPALARPAARGSGPAGTVWPETGAAPGRPAQLPADLADFTGRAGQLALLTQLLDSRRQGSAVAAIVVLSGPAGIGKTSLAVHAGHRLADSFPDGQLYAHLNGTGAPASPASVLGRFLRDLGDDPAGIPVAVGERAARFRSLLAGRRLMIVLDDVRDAAQITPLLPGLGGSAVLVTTRGLLADLPVSSRIMLGDFTPAETRDLLTRIVGGCRVEAEPRAADAVVEQCAGLPLAVRIAGGRLATRPRWRIANFAARLADPAARLGEFAVGGLSVRAAFAASYDNLAAASGDGIDPARAFRLLGMSPGLDISVPAAAALLGTDEPAAGQVLEILLDNHLVQAAGPPGHYWLNGLLHLFAAERACAEEHPRALDMALNRLLAWYLNGPETADPAVAPAAALPLDPVCRASGRRWLARLGLRSGDQDQAAAEAAPAQPVECHGRLAEWIGARDSYAEQARAGESTELGQPMAVASA